MDEKKAKILIADDEVSIRDAIKAILLMDNYRVVIAKNGKEAVEIFKRESPDLVILDVSMPYLTGFQVLEKIKVYFGERYIPVLFLTVSVKMDDKLKALYGGAVDYLTKPTSPEELLARIKNFLEIKKNHDNLKKAAVYDWMTGAMNGAALFLCGIVTLGVRGTYRGLCGIVCGGGRGTSYLLGLNCYHWTYIGMFVQPGVRLGGSV